LQHIGETEILVLNKFCANLIGAPPYDADSMSLSMLRKQQRECFDQVVDDTSKNENGKANVIGNMQLVAYNVIFTGTSTFNHTRINAAISANSTAETPPSSDQKRAARPCAAKPCVAKSDVSLSHLAPHFDENIFVAVDHDVGDVGADARGGVLVPPSLVRS
jgi:hypothetical protein